MIHTAQQKRRMRGVILKLIYENHEAQAARVDDVTITGVLERLQFDVSVNMIREILQDLKDRGFLRYAETRNRFSGAKSIGKIEITAAGRDIVEKTTVDPAVDVE